MYQFKLYTFANVFKKVINPKIIKSGIRFSANINGWLGNFNISINSPITDTSYQIGDIVEVSQFIYGAELKIYTGYISEINRIVTNSEEIELVCYGLNALLSKIVYESAGNYSPTLSGDPYTLINTIITHANTRFNYFTLDGATVGTTVSYETQNNTILGAIKDITELAENHYFYLDRDVLRFKPIPTVATHTFTLAKDIIDLRIDTDESSVSNRLILEYWAGTEVYEDSASIALYGARETYKQDTRITNLATADEYGANFLLKNKDPAEKISLRIKRLAGAEWAWIDEWWEIDTLDEIDFIGVKSFYMIKPWDSCKIRNIKTNYDNLIIHKIDYTDEICTIYLNKYEDFISLIKQ